VIGIADPGRGFRHDRLFVIASSSSLILLHVLHRLKPANSREALENHHAEPTQIKS
jgi:hypothetical protein